MPVCVCVQSARARFTPTTVLCKVHRTTISLLAQAYGFLLPLKIIIIFFRLFSDFRQCWRERTRGFFQFESSWVASFWLFDCLLYGFAVFFVVVAVFVRFTSLFCLFSSFVMRIINNNSCLCTYNTLIHTSNWFCSLLSDSILFSVYF